MNGQLAFARRMASGRRVGRSAEFEEGGNYDCRMGRSEIKTNDSIEGNFVNNDSVVSLVLYFSLLKRNIESNNPISTS